MKAIIMAAGQGTRMGDITKTTPKCLLRYKGEPILKRLITQLKKYSITDIVVVVGYKKEDIIKQIDGIQIVENVNYKNDTNIQSMRLGLQKATDKEDVIIFEADIIVEDELIRYVTGTDFENKSVWFTKGSFNYLQRGGIVKTGEHGNIIDIKIVKEYAARYKTYKKLIGIMRISQNELTTFKSILDNERVDQYYLIPWANNIKSLPSIEGMCDYYLCSSFNTLDEYNKLKCMDFDPVIKQKSIYLKKLKELYPIEEHNKKRIPCVKINSIYKKYWVSPLKIEKKHGLILDGHHRFELAKKMGLKQIPVISFDYKDVGMWSLRKNISLTKDEVIKNAINKKPYPYKTVKHKFPSTSFNCKIKLKELKK